MHLCRCLSFQIAAAALILHLCYLFFQKAYRSKCSNPMFALEINNNCRQQCVKINGVLFCLYINDLPESCKKVGCQMYAEDTIIYVKAETSHMAAEMLTRQLLCVSQWLQDNCLTLYLQQNSFNVFFIKEQSTVCNKTKIDQKEIKEVIEFKY